MKITEKMIEIEDKVRNSHITMPCYHDHHHKYWGVVAQLVTIPGLWLEFGVFRGRSLQRISSLTDATVFGFDSFDGLHEHWDENNPKGVYNSGGMIPKGAIIGPNHSMFDSSPTLLTEPWNKNVKLIKGYFEDSLPSFLNVNLDNAAFIHIDSDLYSSCNTVLTALESRIKNNTIICFDELLDYPNYRDGEILAFAEFLIRTGYDFIPLIHHGVGDVYSQACVRIKC